MHSRNQAQGAHSPATSSSSNGNSSNKTKCGGTSLYLIAFALITVLYLYFVMNFVSKNHSASIIQELSRHKVDKESILQPVDTILSPRIHEKLDELKSKSQQLLKQYATEEDLKELGINPNHLENEKKQEQSTLDNSSHEETEAQKENLVQEEQKPPDTAATIEDPQSAVNSNVEIVKKVKSGNVYPEAISFSTIPVDSVVSEAAKAVVIVGGTDGSGTRRVVQILTELGVAMVSEDPETYDIHADIVGGWPTIVKPVIRQMKKLNYDPEAYSKSNPKEYQKSSEALHRLMTQVDRDSHQPTSYKLAVGGVLPRPKNENITSQNVKYGFKAPVSMTIVPYLAHILPHTKFVHVLRDGRDIAFSANQGPVDKFYVDMYGSDRKSSPVKAIRLWSDWNSQLYYWAKQHVENQLQRQLFISDSKEINPTRSFGYLAVHTEDVVSESRAIRFAAIYHMAKFVGSTISNDRICCMAVENIEFMGSHDRSHLKQHDKNPGQQKLLNSKYGKWKKKTENNPELLKALYNDGNVGLKIFGYDPLRTLPTEAMIAPDGYQCTKKTTDCVYEEPAPAIPNPQDYVFENKCKVQAGIDFKGDDLMAIEYDSKDLATCCRMCYHNPKCKFFTVDPASNTCYMKNGNSMQVNKPGLLSGAVIH